MTDTPAMTAQPGTKPAYVPPRVMRLGDLNDGAGACAAGSGVVTGNCAPGANATGICEPNGNTADSNCLTTGSTAGGKCISNGINPTGGWCNPGGVIY